MAETPLNDTPHRESFGSVEGSVDKPSQGHAAPFAVYPARKSARHCLLRHDSSSGLPESIRPVTNIVVLEPPATDPTDLWGILSTTGDRKPEEIIRAAWADV